MLPPVKPIYEDYLTPSELLFPDVTKLPVPNNILQPLKNETFSSMTIIVSGMNLTLAKKIEKFYKGLWL